MIARVWRGVTPGGSHADRYLEFVTGKVLASLGEIPGHRGSEVLRRDIAEEVEFVVTTYWDTMEAIHAFAGDDAERAVVEPEARALLSDADERVRHFEVAHRAATG